MKKFFIAALALCFAGSAMALDNEPKPGFTYQGLFGFNVTNISGQDMNARVGATAGFMAEYMIPNAHGTFLSAGLNWKMKGCKQNFNDLPLDPKDPENSIVLGGTYRQNLHYLEIPFHVGYRYNINKNLGVFGEVGPYFAMGVSGRYKTTYDTDGYRNMSHSENIMNKGGIFQRYDCGIGFRVGTEIQNHYSFNFGCDWGLLDIYRDTFRDDSAQTGGVTLYDAKNFNFTMTFGYRF